MSACKKARAEATSVVSSDRLSSLPPELKGDILSRLNVEEAVKTSTLSSTWRDAWTNMPKIFLRDGNFARTKFVTLVDMVLSLHNGTVEMFDISGSKTYHDEFGRWMRMLSRIRPRSVTIRLNSGPGYRIPSCLFSIGDLRVLHLQNCVISLPRVFQGFKRLTHLDLKNFSSTDMDIQNLVSFCPVLSCLKLASFEGINYLNVQAPKLKRLHVFGDFEDINLDAPNLEVAILSLAHEAKAHQSVPIAHDMESHVKKSLGDLSGIKTLGISGIFMKYISKWCILTKFPAVFHRLEHIYLVICFWDQRQVLATCSLFQNAPNLKKLDMWDHSSSALDQDQASIQELTMQVQLDHLVTASVKDFRGLDCEVNFLAKLLSWAPALEEVKIEWTGKTECSMVLAKLLALPRVSPRAKFYLDSEAMSTCKKTRAEATSVVSSDRLSSLPPKIKGNVLSRLDVREAVGTSTLSSTWRDAWTDMPKISLRDRNFMRTRFVTLVDMVLALQKGTIEEFDISGKKSYHDELARWMLMLSRRSPRSVTIKLNSGPRYKISSCLFSIGDLKFLQLENCIISLPRAFQGFKSLTYLSLNIFSSTDRDIQNLISFCPVLTDLILTSFVGINRLNIQAPKLEYLNVYGDFEDINLEAPNLKVAILYLGHQAKLYQSVPIGYDKENHVKKSLGSLSEIKTLGITGSFMKYLSKGCILTKLPVVFTRLEDIYLTICFWDQRQVLTAYSLFQNAPNLKKLAVWSYASSTCDQDQARILEHTLQMQMDHLVMACVECFRGLDYEVDFVAKLPSWAPDLEEVKIEWKGQTDCSIVLAKLLALPRVSPRAKVIVTFC
ncbi:uncharacterized protein [Triticum aestivum]|uniref:uncharacterized protein isoform X1 n=1 Tax=Triticum aestivum TaxID=4565 RepID=UPI001D011673|nr:uncharacterized protein LOC123063597 isoform X1 [Triticum aestivum]